MNSGTEGRNDMCDWCDEEPDTIRPDDDDL